MRMSEPMNEIAAALVTCQANVKMATKDAKNPAFGKMYADLASVMEAGREALSGAGLALTFNIKNLDGAVELTPLVFHKSGQFIEFDPLAVRLEKATAQGQGSAMTYGRRYLYQSILGIASEDDDGNSASGTSANVQPKQPVPKRNPELAGKTKIETEPTFTLPEFSGDEEEVQAKSHNNPPLPKTPPKPAPSPETERIKTIMLQIGALIETWSEKEQNEIRARVKSIGKDAVKLEDLKVEIMAENDIKANEKQGSNSQTVTDEEIEALGDYFG